MKRSTLRALLLLACAAAAPSACRRGSRNQSSGEGLTRLTVLHGVSTNNLPLFVAVKRGYFRDEGLELEMKPEISSPRNLELLHLGEVQVAGVGAIPAILGLSRGIKVTAVVENGAYSRESPQQAIAVRRDSGITRMEQLKGRTLAITGFGSHGDVTLAMDILPRAGLTSKDVKLVEIPVAQMEAALASGTVDAALINEPWATDASRSEDLAILSWLEDTIPPTGHILSLLLMQEEFARENPEVVEKFRRAYRRGVEDTKRDFASAIALSSGFLKLPPDLLASTHPFEWPADGQIRLDLLRTLAESMKALGVIEHVPDLESFVWPSSVAAPTSE
jgi:NitT/TauT family transport system substrate-binding protein